MFALLLKKGATTSPMSEYHGTSLDIAMRYMPEDVMKHVLEQESGRCTINTENVLLSTDGSVKIANIGASMLKGIDHKEAQKDVQSLGLIIIECLEPCTSLIKEDTLVMDDWDPSLVKFQKSTKVKTAQELLQDNFLKLSPGPRCLKPYIRLARELGTKQVELVEGD